MEVNVIKLIVENELYHKYPGQYEQQDCYVTLDCSSGDLSASYNSIIGSGVPMDVYHGKSVRWRIPSLTTEAANALLEEISDLAQDVLDGYEEVWDGNNNAGSLDDDAQEAVESIKEVCGATFDDESNVIQHWEAGDWYVNGKKDAARELGITKDTTDEELDLLAEKEEESASDENHFVTGISEYLYSVRDMLVEEANEEEQCEESA